MVFSRSTRRSESLLVPAFIHCLQEFCTVLLVGMAYTGCSIEKQLLRFCYCSKNCLELEEKFLSFQLNFTSKYVFIKIVLNVVNNGEVIKFCFYYNHVAICC